MQRGKKKKKTPTIVNINASQLDEVLQRAESNLHEDDYQLIHEVFNSYSHLTGLLGDKNVRLARLRKLLFGSSSEKTAKVIGNKSSADDCEPATSPEAENTVETPEQVAAVISEALRHADAERIFPCTNCGLAPLSREVASGKLQALGDGAALARGRQ